MESRKGLWAPGHSSTSSSSTPLHCPSAALTLSGVFIWADSQGLAPGLALVGARAREEGGDLF